MANLFFPSHDIALANGVRHFNPPAAALRLQEDLASLYHIWNRPYESGKVPFPQPWGWDWDTRQHIHKEYKIKLSKLPTDEELMLIRQLSSRETTIELLNRLGDTLHVPVFMQSIEVVEAFIDQHEKEGKPFVLKTPWSSSGRGLTRSGVPRATMLKHAQATIDRMGGIIGEEWIDHKLQDFAMLFFVSDHDVRFIGYSLFDNDGTTYRQGYLLSNEEIERRLALSPDELHTVSARYCQILSAMFQPFFGKPWQLGYVGIDMMTYSSPLAPHSTFLAPCVEMNLRCTMGVVCRLWYDENQQKGFFRISPMEGTGHFKAEFIPQL